MNLLGEALKHYAGPVKSLDWAPISNDGFSGALLWCGATSRRPLILAKAHVESVGGEKLRTIHTWQIEAVRAGLNFVPCPVPTVNGHTMIAVANRVWELLDWMPGESASTVNWNEAKLAEACDAVGRLHQIWRTSFGTRVGPCRAVSKRLEVLSRWVDRRLPLPDPERIVLQRRIHAARDCLLPWATRAVRCQPCVRDLRVEHFLFRGDRLDGIIDFAAADWDSPAVDAARMLGEFPAVRDTHLHRLMISLELQSEMRELVILLDWSGTLASLLKWWEWVETPDGIEIPTNKVKSRIAELLNRLAFSPFAC